MCFCRVENSFGATEGNRLMSSTPNNREEQQLYEQKVSWHTLEKVCYVIRNCFSNCWEYCFRVDVSSENECGGIVYQRNPSFDSVDLNASSDPEEGGL